MILLSLTELFPAIYSTAREATVDCVVKGIPIKKETCVLFPVFQLHRNKEVWPNPTKFDPER